MDVSDNNFKGKAGEVLVQALKNKVRLVFLYFILLFRLICATIVLSAVHCTCTVFVNFIMSFVDMNLIHCFFQTQLEYLNLRDDALEGVSASPEKLSLFNALVEAATAGSSLKHVDLSGT